MSDFDLGQAVADHKATARAKAAVSIRLALALKSAGDAISSFGFNLGYWEPVAERILDDADLLDVLVAYRQQQREPIGYEVSE